MKKNLLVICMICLLTLMVSCGNNKTVNPGTITNKTTPTPTIESKATISDYFSYGENKKYVYEGKGNEYASYNVFVDYMSGDRVQLRTDNGGSEIVEVLENKDGKLQMLLSKGECYYRENMTNKSNNITEILLKEPLEKGTTWSLVDGGSRYISNIDVSITTPLGTYKTIEVTTKTKDYKDLDYYAPNVGLVKTIYNSEGFEVSSTLSKIEENIPFTQVIKFFYPNVNSDKLNYIEKTVSFKTNDITKVVFENAFKSPPNANLGKLLGPNVKIKSLYLNKDNMVYVDFTKEFVSEMNAGSGYESMILQGITNTLGTYYGVNKVYITIEGKPYSSGHILMNKGEAFTVNLKNSVLIK